MDQQLRARGMFVKAHNPDINQKVNIVAPPFKMSEIEGTIEKAFPLLGEHTDEILKMLLNYSEEEISRLKKVGVLSPAFNR
jgi:crotonobetainyl-CoA:carnitine CoA-transferase CaiB-like acyl-CoA transferase